MDRYRKVKNVLITQQFSEYAKRSYVNLAKQYNFTVDFFPFTLIEGVDHKTFKLQKINLSHFNVIIFTSKNAIMHFFRIAAALKMPISADTNYVCTSVAVALYLQKFIVYKKRKVFFENEMSTQTLSDFILRFKSLKFLYPCSPEIQDNNIITALKRYDCVYQIAIMYHVTSNDIGQVLSQQDYDIMCFFTVGEMKALLKYNPEFARDQKPIVGTYGSNTLQFALDHQIAVSFMAPKGNCQSMIDALTRFLETFKV